MVETSNAKLLRTDRDELYYHPLGDLLFRMYQWKRLRGAIKRIVRFLEPDSFVTGTTRRILSTYHAVDVGTYSYGCCLTPGYLPRGVVIGRYVSMAQEVSVFRRNHPLDRLSLHPFFYNASLGTLEMDTIESFPLEIGHDAWIGQAARITPGCRRIGVGAVVGTGSVVTRDVPDFAIVGGSPAKIIKFRFSAETCDRILDSQWWEKSKHECIQHMKDMTTSLNDSESHPFL